MAFSKITGSGLGSQVVDTAQLKDDAVTSAKVDTNIAVAGTITNLEFNSDGFGFGSGATSDYINGEGIKYIWAAFA